MAHFKKKRISPVSSERPTEVQMKWKVFEVDVRFEFFQPNGGLHVIKQKPEKDCWEAYALL